MLARAFVRMWRRKGRGVGSLDGGGDPIVQRLKRREQLVLRREPRRITTRDAARLEGLSPTLRQRRVVAQSLQQPDRCAREVTQAPRRVIDDSVRLLAHLLGG